MLHDPAETESTLTEYEFALAPDLTQAATTSVAAMALLVREKATDVAATKAAPLIVIVPVTLLSVTPVDLLVACVTVPPAPAAYPTPAVEPFERMAAPPFMLP